MKLFGSIRVGAVVTCVSLAANAQLFRDPMTNAAAWGVNANGSDWAVTFNYDYSADGIPEAPNTLPGDAPTRGARLEANLFSGTVNYFTIFPLGQNFTGWWQLRFDAWMNFGTSGTTEFLGGGIGYNGTSADANSGAQFIATGDGGSAADWRALKDGFYVTDDTAYAGGSRDNTAPYYTSFLPSVNGSVAGSPGFQWITWEFNVIGNQVSIYIEKPDLSRLLLIQYDKTFTGDGSGGATTDGNLSIFYADYSTSIASPPGSTFGLVDNVVVWMIPEPATGSLALGGLGLLWLFRRRR
ncbi:MAG: hypothetical protein N3I86_15460 [Verrucomicrobiae bacterium]|nr:hypothetical protein [Verrucomicrobiae bacterium]MDW8310105.1 MYXO-CTERM sorting domain-containing protein [Verrucomicrobiales bacterium]